MGDVGHVAHGFRSGSICQKILQLVAKDSCWNSHRSHGKKDVVAVTKLGSFLEKICDIVKAVWHEGDFWNLKTGCRHFLEP